MFAVEVVSAATTILFVRDLVAGGGAWFSGQISLWLWFTVLFANFAEAVAEGRGKAQAATLRRTQSQAVAKRLASGGQHAMGGSPGKPTQGRRCRASSRRAI